MLLQLEDYRKHCIYKLVDSLKTALSCQQLMFITEKLKRVKEAESITQITQIMELDIGLRQYDEQEINMKKAEEWSKQLITDNELMQESLRTTLFYGLNWLCALRTYHCIFNNLTYTPNYIKVLNVCYKKNGYCPCKIPQPGTFCPCEENLDEIEKDGHCHCNMFKK